MRLTRRLTARLLLFFTAILVVAAVTVLVQIWLLYNQRFSRPVPAVEFFQITANPKFPSVSVVVTLTSYPPPIDRGKLVFDLLLHSLAGQVENSTGSATPLSDYVQHIIFVYRVESKYDRAVSFWNRRRYRPETTHWDLLTAYESGMLFSSPAISVAFLDGEAVDPTPTWLPSFIRQTHSPDYLGSHSPLSLLSSRVLLRSADSVIPHSAALPLRSYTVVSAGVDIADLGSGTATDTDAPLIAYHRFRGLSAAYRPACRSADVFGVTPQAFLVRRAVWPHWNAVRHTYSVATEPTSTLRLLNFALAVRRYGTSFSGVWEAGPMPISSVRLVAGADVVLVPPPFAETEPQLRKQWEQMHLDSSQYMQSSRRLLVPHVAWLRDVIAARYLSTSTPVAVHWQQFAPCSGLGVELQRLIASLNGRVRQRVTMATASSFPCGGLPPAIADVITRARGSDYGPALNNYAVILFPLSLRLGELVVRIRTVYNDARFLIGRVVAETDRVSDDIARGCEYVDTVWVPAAFLVDSLNRSGVLREKVRVVPIPIDGDWFDRTLHDPLPGTQFGEARRDNPTRPFTFLSIFKMEERKNPHALFTAFLEEFSRNDPVRLVVVTYLFDGPPDVDPRDPNDVWRLVRETWLYGRLNGTLRGQRLRQRELAGDWPPVVLVTDELPDAAVPRLYRSADCFVTATHGEGWGLPLQEAVAMEIPVIATNWSGHVDFLSPHDVDLVPVARMEPATQQGFTGNWAEISVKHLRAAMRRVFGEAPAEAAARAARARQWMLDRTGADVVARHVAERLEALSTLPTHLKRKSPLESAATEPDSWMWMVQPVMV